MKSFSAGVAEQLGWYVYLYRDPRDDTIFYVGKGKDNRVFDHLEDKSETEKVKRIAAIRAAGKEPQLEILRHNLPDEKTAFLVEAVAMDLLRESPLTTLTGGHGSRDYGQKTVEEITAKYSQPVEISPEHKVILIRVNQHFYPGITAPELYDITRGVWKASDRVKTAEYAFAVYQGVVREVYRPEKWHIGGSTKYETRIPEEVKAPDRWEFTGEIAEESVRRQYRLKSVVDYFPYGSANPIRYVNF